MADIREQIRNIMFEECEAVESRPKDYSIILDEKGVDESVSRLEQLIKEKQAEAEEKKRKEINRMIFSAEPYDKGEGWVALKFSEGLYRNIAGEIAFNDRIAELESGGVAMADKLTKEQERFIRKAVDLIVEEYGETLRLLGKKS